MKGAKIPGPALAASEKMITTKGLEQPLAATKEMITTKGTKVAKRKREEL